LLIGVFLVAQADAPAGGGGEAACEGGAGAAVDGEVRVVAAVFCFDPAVIPLPVGRPIRLVLENRGGADHDLVVAKLDLHLAAGSGATESTTVRGDEPERYAAVCSLPGHEQLGMRAVVVVQ
jgi:uncharacterized cupredoxin-like copper-binding protein